MQHRIDRQPATLYDRQAAERTAAEIAEHEDDHWRYVAERYGNGDKYTIEAYDAEGNHVGTF